jgi:hypothetical protein
MQRQVIGGTAGAAGGTLIGAMAGNAGMGAAIGAGGRRFSLPQA